MTSNQELSNRIAQVISDDGTYTTRSYSGRGMYGKSCLAIEVNSVADSWAIALILAEGFTGDAESLVFLRPNTDSMGLGAILYFQDLPPAEDEWAE